jgi:hypothetical protein
VNGLRYAAAAVVALTLAGAASFATALTQAPGREGWWIVGGVAAWTAVIVIIRRGA